VSLTRSCCCGGSIPPGSESCGTVTAQTGLTFSVTATQAGFVRGKPTGIYVGSGCGTCASTPLKGIGWTGWDDSIGPHQGLAWLTGGSQPGGDPDCACDPIAYTYTWPSGSWNASFSLSGFAVTQTSLSHTYTSGDVYASLRPCTRLDNPPLLVCSCLGTTSGYYDVLSIYVIGQLYPPPWAATRWKQVSASITTCEADPDSFGADPKTWAVTAQYCKPASASARTISGTYTRYLSKFHVPNNAATRSSPAYYAGAVCPPCAPCSGTTGGVDPCLCGSPNTAGFVLPNTITIA